MRKGQMFIISAIFILVIVVLIRNSVGSFELLEESRFQDTRYAEKSLRNLVNEMRNTVAAGAVQQDPNTTTMEYLRNISLMARDDFDTSIMYIYILANGTNQRYQVTIGNYLQDRMNITFNATNSNPGGRLFIIEDRANLTREYNSSVNGTVEINVTYTSRNIESTERFNVTTSTRNQASAFLDITVRDKDLEARAKETYNWTWPV